MQKHLNIPITGVMDDFTIAAFNNFKLKNDFNFDEFVEYIDGLNDSDLSFLSKKTFTIFQKFLPTTQYFEGPTKKDNIFLHFTSGWNNPYDVIKDWANDTRGRIGTHYVIGGINISSNDSQFDGTIVQTIPETGYAWHIGIGNTPVHRNSLSIELCNFGPVTSRNGKFYTYTNREINKKYVADLKTPFRGFRYYHELTDKQIESTIYLCKELAQRHNIDITKGLVGDFDENKPFNTFQYKDSVVRGIAKGLHTHTNVSNSINGSWSKFDLAPTPKTIELIRKLKNVKN